MWETICTTDQCRWSSTACHLREAAIVLGKLHESDRPGHTVTVREVGRTIRAAVERAMEVR